MTKLHILDEVKRTSRENGGVPLGWRRFSAETGIRLSDLNRNGIPRYSDACQEAGFVANKLVAAYSDDYLLERYAALAKEVGRLPGKGDMKVKAHADAGFPEDSTFARALGKKEQLLTKLMQFCSSHDRFSDVAEMIRASSKVPRDISDDGEAMEGVEIGFVYLMKSGKFYKVGV